MTRRRLAALAQALVLAVILVPGLSPGGLALAQSGNASARGLGCTSGVGSFRGPRVPGDPPPPPGRASAQATPGPADSPAPIETTSPQLDPPESELGDGPTALLAATGIRIAQAEPTEPTESSPPADDTALPPTVDDAGPAAGSPDPATDSAIDPIDPSEPRPRRDRQRVRGIDVSHHNGEIDYDLVLDSGRTFAYIKATQDTTFRDPLFEANLQRARQAGVYTGAYHFFDYTLDGVEQADHFLDRVEAAGGLLGSLPPVVDVECWAPSGVSTHLTSAQRLRDFIDRVYERTGRLPVVYTSVFMWDQVVGGTDGFGDLPLWAACWGCAAPPALASGWDDWRFWQTGVARIPRVGRLDGNVFNGTPEDLAAMLLRPFRIEGGAGIAGSATVTLDLGGLDGDEFRTSPDGASWTAWRPLRSAALAEMRPVEGPQALHVQLRSAGGTESPVFSDEITLDLAGPNLASVDLAIASTAVPADGSLVPVVIRWEASDGVTGLADATVEVACGEDPPTSLLLPSVAAPASVVPFEATAFVATDSPCDVGITAPDGFGNVTTERFADVAATFLAADPSQRVRHLGQWRTEAVEGAHGGAVHVAATPESELEAIVAGHEAAIVAVRGPSGGQATVTLDGQPVASVDLYAATSGSPEVVATVPLTPRTRHVLGLTPEGAANPAASGTDVAVDAILMLTTEPGGLEVPEPTPEPTPEPSVGASPSPGPEATVIPPSVDPSPVATPTPTGASPAPAASAAPAGSPEPAVSPAVEPTAPASEAPVSA